MNIQEPTYMLYSLIGVVTIVAFLLASYLVQRRLKMLASMAETQSVEIMTLRGYLSQIAPDSGSGSESYERSEDIVDCHAPDELINALVANQCVLFAGPGLSATIGLPTRHEFVDRLLNKFRIE